MEKIIAFSRILVTNALSYLDRTDGILVLKGGEIVESGTYQDLSKREGGELARFLSAQSQVGTSESAEESTGGKVSKPKLKKRLASVAGDEYEEEEREEEVNEDGRLVQEEASAEGHVGMYVYLRYIRNLGAVYFCGIALLYALGQTFQTSTGLLLAGWANANDDHSNSNSSTAASAEKYLGTYAGLAASDSAVSFTRELLLLLLCCRVSRSVHDSLLSAVLRSPMAFFDTTPTGRVLNRFSADINAVDQVGIDHILKSVNVLININLNDLMFSPQTIPVRIAQMLMCLAQVVATLAPVIYAVPLVAVVFVPLGAFFAFVQRYFTATSSQLERLDYVSRSPMLSHLSESLQGVASIRYAKHRKLCAPDSSVAYMLLLLLLLLLSLLLLLLIVTILLLLLLLLCYCCCFKFCCC